MNQYLTTLLETVAIDISHLTNNYLNASEQGILNSLLTSEKDFLKDFYTCDLGDNLECLLFFLTAHKKEILALMQGSGNDDILKKLYVSITISGNYDCFRFDLTKFSQSYTPRNETLTLYRIGKHDEHDGNLGCSWATSISGLRAYCVSSTISKSMLDLKPIFIITIDDDQVLMSGSNREAELVLKPKFTYRTFDYLNDVLRNQICLSENTT